MVLVLLSCLSSSAMAHDRSGHDADLEYVLFGEEQYKETHPLTADIIQALEDAAYLCVDQYNGYGQEDLDYLKGRNIPALPDGIDKIDFTSNYSHRNFTHRGWNILYPEKSHWKERRSILVNTVQKEIFDNATPLDWFPWLSDVVYGSGDYDEKVESLSALIYYVHVIGDHLEAEKYTALGYVAPLTNMNDRDNPGIIPDLIRYMKILFSEQSGTFTYSDFLQELEYLQDKSDRLTGSVGGVDTEEEFKKYHECASDLRETLSIYVPILLKNESYFYNTFFSGDST